MLMYTCSELPHSWQVPATKGLFALAGEFIPVLAGGLGQIASHVSVA